MRWADLAFVAARTMPDRRAETATIEIVIQASQQSNNVRHRQSIYHYSTSTLPLVGLGCCNISRLQDVKKRLRLTILCMNNHDFSCQPFNNIATGVMYRLSIIGRHCTMQVRLPREILCRRI